MKKPIIEPKHPSASPNKRKPTKKVEKEPLAEGYIQEPHAEYGLLNDEVDKENIKE